MSKTTMFLLGTLLGVGLGAAVTYLSQRTAAIEDSFQEVSKMRMEYDLQNDVLVRFMSAFAEEVPANRKCNALKSALTRIEGARASKSRDAMVQSVQRQIIQQCTK